MRRDLCVQCVGPCTKRESFLCSVSMQESNLQTFASFILTERKKLVTASEDMQDPIQIGIVLKLFVGFHGVKMGTKKLVYP